MSTPAPSAAITLYPSPLDGGDYLAVLDSTGTLPEPAQVAVAKATKTIIILDVSGSMGHYVEMCIDTLFPAVFKANNYDPEDEIELIRFECSAHHNTHRVKEFGSLGYSTLGGTSMAPVFPILEKLLRDCEPGTNVRIFAVSDGDIFDTDETIRRASALSSTVEGLILNIDAVAIRLFSSSYAQPDTRALSTIMQLNNTFNTPTLVDIIPDESNPPAEVAALLTPQMVAAFDIKSSNVYLAAPGVVDPEKKLARGSEEDVNHPQSLFKQHPWSQSSTVLPLSATAKRTLFWVDKAKWDAINPARELTVSDVLPVPVTVLEALTGDLYEEIIATRVQHYMMQIKLLRIVGSEHSLKQVKLMADYFVKLEAAIFTDATAIAEEKHDDVAILKLSDRLAKLFKDAGSEIKRLSHAMAQIANMDATVQFNSAQAASFLRSTTGNAGASRGLVRRAKIDEYTDFDGTVRREAFALANKFDEFMTAHKITPEVEETVFKQSFVSLGTTLDGLRALQTLARTSTTGQPLDKADWAKESLSMLSTMSAFDILSYFNIVGLPVQSTIGDYPDPFRYNINVAFPGHYCSLSDLINLQAFEDSQQPPADPNAPPAPAPADAPKSNLFIPGYRGEEGRIDNVIPLFDTPELAKFFSDNATQSLIFLSSIGMRRVMATISETPYAMYSAAIVKLMRVVLVEPTEVNFKALRQLHQALQFDRSATILKNERLNELQQAVNYIEKPATPLNLVQSVSGHYVSLMPILTKEAPDATYFAQMQSPFSQFLYPLALAMANKTALQPVSDDQFAGALRALYVNEVWMTLRGLYRGKEDGIKLMRQYFQSLIGYDENWEPALTPLGEADAEFNPDMVPDWKNNAFVKSKTWKEVGRRLNRLNIILALPYFAQLFAAWTANDEEKAEELQQNPVRVLLTPETPEMLKKAAKLAEYKKLIGGNTDDNDDDDYAYDNGDIVAAGDAAAIEQYKVLVKEMEEEMKGARDEVNNTVEMLWPQVLFNYPDIDDTNTSQSYMNTLKLVATAAAFLYPEPANRFQNPYLTLPRVPYNATFSATSYIRDIPYTSDLSSLPFIQQLFECRVQYYRERYNDRLAAKAKKEAEGLMIEYRRQLVAAPTMDLFNRLLSEGLKFGSRTVSFEYNYRDWHFAPLWKTLTAKNRDDAAPIPLHLEKLEVILLGVDAAGKAVWNNGNILLDHNLQDAAHVFYDANERKKWIELCNIFKIRRQSLKYRDSDLPNRHSHNNSHPSYYSLGYETLVEFKAAVGEEAFKAYAEKHADCCGFTSLGQKRTHLGGFRHDAPAAAADAAADGAVADEEKADDNSFAGLFD